MENYEFDKKGKKNLEKPGILNKFYMLSRKFLFDNLIL